ncbi:MAG: response regulator [Pseudomonadota bacterium]
MSANILIVEDEMMIAFDMEATLEDLGHVVVGIAPDLETAMSIADEHSIDLALVDMNLRDGQTGPEIGRRLCSRRKCAVLFVTANPRELGEGIAGAIGVVTKPANPEAVRTAVEYALNVSRGAVIAAPPPALRLFSQHGG